MSRAAMEMALDALCMPVARWNKIQTMKVDAAIKALRAELAKPEWLPIESAPKDGTVDIWANGGRYTDCKFRRPTNSSIAECWCFEYEDAGVWDALSHPTHWMPIPSAPT